MTRPDPTDSDPLRRLYARRVSATTPPGVGCAPVEAILALVRREGSEPERLATLDHVMACSACHREYEWLRAVGEAAAEMEDGGDVRRRWWGSAPLALAASLAGVAGAGFLAWNALLRRPEPVRGTEVEIVLVAPAAGAADPGALTFVWRSAPGATRYVLEVRREDGAVALADTVGDTTLTLGDRGRVLSRGDYDWWVRELTDGAEPRSSELRLLRVSPSS